MLGTTIWTDATLVISDAAEHKIAQGSDVSDSPFMGFSGPLYDQVHRHLRARILAGEWEHRQPLPPEVALSHELGVSVGTVRKAMEKLMRENIVVRERGRGTFIRRNTNRRPTSMLIIRDRDGSTIEPKKRLVSYSAIGIPDRDACTHASKRDFSTSLPTIKFEREWRANNILVCRETIMVHQQSFLVSTKMGELAGDALLGEYLNQHHMHVHSVRWEIGSQHFLVPEDASTELKAPSIIVTRYGLDVNAEPFEVCEHEISLGSHTFEIVQ